MIKSLRYKLLLVCSIILVIATLIYAGPYDLSHTVSPGYHVGIVKHWPSAPAGEEKRITMTVTSKDPTRKFEFARVEPGIHPGITWGVIEEVNGEEKDLPKTETFLTPAKFWGYIAKDSKSEKYVPIFSGKFKSGGGRGGGVTDLTWDFKADIDILGVDLDVDSDNDGKIEKDNGEEDKIEEDSPGVIVPVNDNFDEKNKGLVTNPDGTQGEIDVPDNVGDGSTDGQGGQHRIIKKAEKDKQLRPAVLELNPKKIDKKELVGKLKWTIGSNIKVWWKKDKKDKEWEEIENGDEFENFKAGKKVDLWLEGISPGEGMIEVSFTPKDINITCVDKVKYTIIGGKLTIDSNNDGRIDDNDDSVEDISKFLFWINDDDNSSPSTGDHKVYAPKAGSKLPISDWNSSNITIDGLFDLIDFFPLKIHVDQSTRQALTSAGYTLSLRSEGLRFFISSKENVQNGVVGTDSYMFKKSRGNDQVSKGQFHNGGVIDDVAIEEKDFDSDDNIWLLFEAMVSIPGLDHKINLVVKDSQDNIVLIGDEVKLDIKHSKEFFQTVSVRGKQTLATYDTERLKDNGTVRFVEIDEYKITPTVEEGSLLHDANNVLIMVHGWNVDPSNSNMLYQNVYKKLYRLGYRGDMIGYKWEGNQLEIPVPGLTPFDANVENAFESRRGLMTLINSLKNSGKTVNLAAHSLGNLVVMDALRGLVLDDPSKKYVNNVIHIEAAVWNTLYNARPAPGDDYSDRKVEQKAEWDHWCADVPNGITGEIVNSFNPGDIAWIAMIANDVAVLVRQRWLGPPPLSPYLRYKLWALAQTTYRAPEKLSYYIPANPNGFPNILSGSPQGAKLLSQTHFLNKISYNASMYGWSNRAHSDYRDKIIQEIFYWYKTVMIPYLQ